MVPTALVGDTYKRPDNCHVQEGPYVMQGPPAQDTRCPWLKQSHACVDVPTFDHAPKLGLASKHDQKG